MRKAADIACKSLHKVTVRACDGASMDKTGMKFFCYSGVLYIHQFLHAGTKVAKSVLPLLLTKGMTNPSNDVRAVR